MAAKKSKNRRRSAPKAATTRKSPRRRHSSQKRPLVGFIGAGNMARSLAGGLIANGWPASRVVLSDPEAGQRGAVGKLLKVRTYADNNEVAAQAGILVLAVKPQALPGVAKGIAAAVQKHRPLIVSIVAGIRIRDIQRWLGGNLAIVRTMPNTPALVSSGATGMHANEHTTDAMRAQAESILRAVGVTVWLEREDLIDAVTAVSGSGPAYFFLVMEALENAAIAEGLDAPTARLLTLETAFGAAKMALEGSEPPATLRQRVTSPGGTTERALNVMRERGLEKIFAEAVRAANQRARELADLLGKD
jgi:pyrroline-5-carboxylate reductase